MKIKTSELTGKPLDYAVAVCEGGTGFIYDGITMCFEINNKTRVLAAGWTVGMNYCPSNDWSTGGPIIEREGIELSLISNYWEAMIAFSGKEPQKGPTPLIAAMRCYVASKLGDEVEVPEELK
jgi:hypothetical protein